MTQKEMLYFATERFAFWSKLEKMLFALSNGLIERRRENPEVTLKLRPKEHEDAWMTGVWNRSDYHTEVTTLRDDEH